MAGRQTIDALGEDYFNAQPDSSSSTTPRHQHTAEPAQQSASDIVASNMEREYIPSTHQERPTTTANAGAVGGKQIFNPPGKTILLDN